MSKDIDTDSRPELLPESRESLWLLTVPPTVWAVHFLASYITGAVWCAKVASEFGPLGIVRSLILWYTVAALTGIGYVGWKGFRRHSYGTAAVPHDFDTPEDRHRFMGFATLLLAGLSAVATIFTALAAYFIETCR